MNDELSFGLEGIITQSRKTRGKRGYQKGSEGRKKIDWEKKWARGEVIHREREVGGVKGVGFFGGSWFGGEGVSMGRGVSVSALPEGEICSSHIKIPLLLS